MKHIDWLGQIVHGMFAFACSQWGDHNSAAWPHNSAKINVIIKHISVSGCEPLTALYDWFLSNALCYEMEKCLLLQVSILWIVLV